MNLTTLSVLDRRGKHAALAMAVIAHPGLGTATRHGCERFAISVRPDRLYDAAELVGEPSPRRLSWPLETGSPPAMSIHPSRQCQWPTYLIAACECVGRGKAPPWLYVLGRDEIARTPHPPARGCLLARILCRTGTMGRSGVRQESARG